MAQWTTGRAPVGGADWIVLEVITDTVRSLPAIAAAAKVEQSAAREALNRLRQQGKVRKYGGRKHARYVRINRRSRRASC